MTGLPEADASAAADETAPGRGCNRPAHELPAACDVLVVGAGPAGSAAALTLAHAGWNVVLVDQHTFPRDKVCGDGLIPDAHHALRRLGVLDEVLSKARSAAHVACIGPRGGRVDVPGTLAVLPRRVLDDVLCRAAVRAGACMFAPLRLVAVLEQAMPGGAGTEVTGARLQGAAGKIYDIHAPWVVLATGAVPQALAAAGLCQRRTPSGVALRGYIKHEAMAARLQALEVVWHPRIKPGYGWIFPGPGGVFNIGVGVAHSHARGALRGRNMQDINLRQVFKDFTEIYPPAGELVAQGEWTSELKGAPLRCSLDGATLSRPGLLVAGEAAGSTYAFTGEGIGKALETGLLAAQALLHGRQQNLSDAQLRAGYEQQLQALKPRYAMYEKANVVNAHPWLVDLLVWSARRSPSRLKRMSGVLEETHVPSNLVSLKSWLRLVFVHR